MITEIALASDTRSVITEAKLRITHASPSTPEVDLYFVEDGTDIAGVEPTFGMVPFGASTGQLSIDTSLTYDVYVTLAGSKAAAIAVPDVTFDGGEVIDIIARDGDMGPELTVLDYGETGNVAACPAP